MAASSSIVEASIAHATEKLGLDSLKQQQKKALESFLRGHDVFMGLPTGFGKSVVFQAAALCMDFKNNVEGSDGKKNFVVVVMPLKALIQDQLDRARKLGIAAADISGGYTDDILQQLSEGKISIITTSPEFLVGESGSNFMKFDFVQQRLCGLFVDESHCVSKWGHSSGKAKAFRSCYGQLGELRSTLPSVPVIAMTATATADVKKKVSQSLGLRNYVTIAESPDKGNIKHIYLETRSQEFDESLEFLVEEIIKKREKCERVLIYCQSRKMVSEVYAMFFSKLPSSCAGLVQMFHTNTEDNVQKMITADMGNSDGRIRVLIATIAFGMGVNVQGTNTAIMLGRPSDLDDYLQMAGRIGRDGKESISIMVKYPGDIAGRCLTPSMKRFLKGDECRRGVISENFCSASSTSTSEKHRCCDVCARQCVCSESDNKCNGKLSRFEELAVRAFATAPVSTELPLSIPSPAQQDKLRRSLEEYRDELVRDQPDHLYSGKDIASGLPASTIDRILRESNVLLSKMEFMRRYKFSRCEIGNKTWEMYLTSLERTEVLSDNYQYNYESDGSDHLDMWSGDEYGDAIAEGSHSDND